MKIPKIPYPLIAYRFSCDYAHEWEDLLCISALRIRRNIESKLMEIVHAWNSRFYTDVSILEHPHLLDIIKKRQEKIIHAIEDSEVLRKLLWIKSLRYDVGKGDEGSFEYSPLWDHFTNGLEWEIELFKRHWMTLITGCDTELLRLFSWKKK